jgi:hypothetical protein
MGRAKTEEPNKQIAAVICSCNLLVPWFLGLRCDSFTVCGFWLEHERSSCHLPRFLHRTDARSGDVHCSCAIAAGPLKQPWFILDSVCAACNANAERVSLRQKHWGKLRRLRNEFRHSHHVSLAKNTTAQEHGTGCPGADRSICVDTYVQYTCTRPIPLPAISCSGHSNLELGICQRDPLNNQVRCKMWG